MRCTVSRADRRRGQCKVDHFARSSAPCDAAIRRSNADRVKSNKASKSPSVERHDGRIAVRPPIAHAEGRDRAAPIPSRPSQPAGNRCCARSALTSMRPTGHCGLLPAGRCREPFGAYKRHRPMSAATNHYSPGLPPCSIFAICLFVKLPFRSHPTRQMPGFVWAHDFINRKRH